MARSRRRKSKQKRSKGRRGGLRGITGGVTGNIMPIIGMVAGALAGKLIVNKALEKSTLDPKIKSAIPLVGGVVLRMIDKSNGLMSNIGNGMIVIGGVQLASSLIPGLEGITEADIFGIEEDITVGGEEWMQGDEITVGDAQMEGHGANEMD